MENRNKIENSFCTVESIKEGVVCVSFKKDTRVDVEILKTLIDSSLKIANGKPYHSIIDISNGMNEITPEAREYLSKADTDNKLKKSQLIIIDSMSKSIMLGMVLKVMKLSKPTKSFSSLDKALVWVEEFDSQKV